MKNERLGEENYNNFGTLMKIIEYNNARDIWVEFQDEHKTKFHTRYEEFKKGVVKNPYDRTVYGIGYIGEGIYSKKDYPYIYRKWKSMLQRCYDPYYLNKENSYIDCYVCEEWHNLQNFGKWYEENIYECNNERIHLDKDILFKGNKIYSSDTCMLVPERINKLFVKCDANRGKYPIGVNWHKATNKFVVQCNVLDKESNRKVHLGLYDSIEEAFSCYKVFKENYIKQTADEYKELIPQKLYDALYKYEIEIND